MKRKEYIKTLLSEEVLSLFLIEEEKEDLIREGKTIAQISRYRAPDDSTWYILDDAINRTLDWLNRTLNDEDKHWIDERLG